MIRSKVAALLRSRHIAVTEVDANVNCKPPVLYDLTLAIHYQSDTHSSGFGVFVPDASVDQVSARSIAMAKAIAKVYAGRTGLANYSSPRLGFGPVTWENPNTLFYYVWQTQLGPLALIECGEGAVGAKDHTLLYGSPDKVASAIAEGICSALGVAFVAPPTAAQIAAAAAAVKAQVAAIVAKAAADKAAADAIVAAKNAADAAMAKAIADAAAAKAELDAKAAADKVAADAKAVADAAQAAKDAADVTAAAAAIAAQAAADAAARASDAEAKANAALPGLLVRFFSWILSHFGGK